MAISDLDFAHIQKLVLKRSAIVLDNDKKYLVESRLSPIIRTENLSGFNQLVDDLKSPGGEPLIKKVVEAMTTNETSFFRDVKPFEALKTTILPEIIEARRSERRLSIWCAAASSGQEPYTISMVIRENFPELLNWDLTILGTDLSSQILDRARAGVYSQLEMNRGLPAQLLVKYFTKEGIVWEAKPDLRNMMEFREMNLATTWPTLPKMDIIFLRNVLIYFDLATKRSIVGRAGKLLAQDGYLFLGSAETTLNINDGFERAPFERAGCYRFKDAERSRNAVLTT